MSTSVRVILSTFPSSEKAAEVAKVLVEERACACVNIVPAVRSIYRWDDKVADESEVLALIKTSAERVATLVERLTSLHPYEVPEIVVIDVDGVSAGYRDWILASTR